MAGRRRGSELVPDLRTAGAAGGSIRERVARPHRITLTAADTDGETASASQSDGCSTGEEGIDVLLVVVLVDDLDGQGGSLAQAGRCPARTDDAGNFTLPISGLVILDEADLGNAALEEIVTHEMDHVLGIGIGVIEGRGSKATDLETNDPFFTLRRRAPERAGGGSGEAPAGGTPPPPRPSVPSAVRSGPRTVACPARIAVAPRPRSTGLRPSRDLQADRMALDRVGDRVARLGRVPEEIEDDARPVAAPPDARPCHLRQLQPGAPMIGQHVVDGTLGPTLHGSLPPGSSGRGVARPDRTVAAPPVLPAVPLRVAPPAARDEGL